MIELSELRAKQEDRPRQIELLRRARTLQAEIRPPDLGAEADLEMQLATAFHVTGKFSTARKHWQQAATLYEQVLNVPPKREPEVQRDRDARSIANRQATAQ